MVLLATGEGLEVGDAAGDLLREDSQDIHEADLSLCSGLIVISLSSSRCNVGRLGDILG